ncbi:hypothetical protein Pan181_11860 [Aeoliella mucimassa]|uniref:VWFA domain-containing protein n=2 Tax=Aeoliella mucimassa TaxID=2527972 RepID=A0A518AJT7_9BACT|nr:hypothetical protein Pan181_11860 [Aeoliella mucimassa]
MLGWLGAAAAPILIHLWMRHTHRDTPWAAMEFLRQAIQRNSRRLKLQQWLLLAIRTLLLVLLALAATKPYLSNWNLLTGGPQMHRVLVIDATMSMQYAEGEQSSFARAKQLATEMLDSGRPGDVYSLCVLAETSADIVAGPSADPRRIAAQVGSLEATYASGRLGDVLPTIADLMDQAETNHRSLSGHEVLFFSDAAKHTWQSATAGQADQSTLAELTERAQVTLVDVGPAEPTGVSIHHLRVASGLSTTAEPLHLVADVTNYGDTPVSDLPVQLLVQGTSIDEQVLTLPANSTLPVEFDARFTESAWQSLSVRTRGDALAADDQAWLALDVRPSVRTLVVEGTPRAARYLRHALDPGGGTASPVQVVVAAEGALVDQPLVDFDCIFLCNIAQFTPAERTLLERYVLQGGSLIFVLGDRVMADSYNQPLAASPLGWGDWALASAAGDWGLTLQLPPVESPAAANAGWLPAGVGPLKANQQPGIDPLEYRHPIAAAFLDHERAGLLSTPVSRYFQLQPTSTAQVALALPNGDPLLVTSKHGQGMVAMLATTATLDTVDPNTNQPWTLMPAWPSFLPIVRELVAFGLAATWADDQAEIGQAIAGPVPASFSATTLKVERPDQQTAEVPIIREDATANWQYVSTNLPGIYTAGDSLARVAVNVPAMESDLTRVDQSLLPEAVQVQSAPPDASVAGESLATNTSLHRTFLYFVLVLLLIEPLMAWWFAGRAV